MLPVGSNILVPSVHDWSVKCRSGLRAGLRPRVSGFGVMHVSWASEEVEEGCGVAQMWVAQTQLEDSGQPLLEVRWEGPCLLPTRGRLSVEIQCGGWGRGVSVSSGHILSMHWTLHLSFPAVTTQLIAALRIHL